MTDTSTRRLLRTAGIVITLLALSAGCTASARRLPIVQPVFSQSATPGYGPQVVQFAGFRDITFGEMRADLTAKGYLKTEGERCGPRLARTPELTPMFEGDRLVMVWVNPPFHTPEGLGIGTPLAEVRRTYPTVRELTPVDGSHSYPGLLLTKGDRAYLFLHDAQRVQKLIIGVAKNVERFFAEGFSAC